MYTCLNARMGLLKRVYWNGVFIYMAAGQQTATETSEKTIPKPCCIPTMLMRLYDEHHIPQNTRKKKKKRKTSQGSQRLPTHGRLKYHSDVYNLRYGAANY